MDRREFLRNAAATIPAALKVLTEKSEDQTAPKPISYPKGWGKKDGKFVYKAEGATSLEGKPIDFSFYEVGKTAATDGVFTPSSMKGKTWIMAGLFTHCGSFCPNTIATAIELQDKIIAAGLKEKIGILLVDLDPVSDTPDKLRNYGGGG